MNKTICHKNIMNKTICHMCGRKTYDKDKQITLDMYYYKHSPYTYTVTVCYTVCHSCINNVKDFIEKGSHVHKNKRKI